VILYPDQREPPQENETVITAAPIKQHDWDHLYELGRKNEIKEVAMRYAIITGEDVYFMRNRSDITDRVCILLRRMEDDDTCLEATAWIRIRENYPGMVYWCRWSTADKWQTFSSAAGAPQHQVAMVDLYYDLEE